MRNSTLNSRLSVWNSLYSARHARQLTESSKQKRRQGSSKDRALKRRERGSRGRTFMIGIVKLALRRPYTFIVMPVLILIFGTASALRTPTDIFPNINIPVISVVFSFTGLTADAIAGRVGTVYV